jgi:hypothetical protein
MSLKDDYQSSGRRTSRRDVRLNREKIVDRNPKIQEKKCRMI